VTGEIQRTARGQRAQINDPESGRVTSASPPADRQIGIIGARFICPGARALSRKDQASPVLSSHWVGSDAARYSSDFLADYVDGSLEHVRLEKCSQASVRPSASPCPRPSSRGPPLARAGQGLLPRSCRSGCCSCSSPLGAAGVRQALPPEPIQRLRSPRPAWHSAFPDAVGHGQQYGQAPDGGTHTGGAA